MRCPNCYYPTTSTLESRPRSNGEAMYRRRKCPRCGHKFSTREEWDIPAQETNGFRLAKQRANKNQQK